MLQIFGLCLLSFYTSSWGLYSSIIWIMIAQGISGIAKDISKTSFKKKVKYGKNVLVGKNVKIGKNCLIGHNTIIEKNVIIG